MNTVIKLNEMPDLWIERLVIYSDLTERTVLQDISLSRGLNIIWGVSNVANKKSASANSFLIGHSVGKTSLCRLIRYALDEETFGQEDAMEQVRTYFGGGGIGLRIHLKGVPWSVVRKFSSSTGSLASQTIELDTLVELLPNDAPYAAFREAIRANLAQGVPGFDEKDGFHWRDLLAWMSRDQEARYGSMWKWRETRSNSKTPGLSKDHAFRLISSVLGLFSHRANQFVLDLEAINSEIRSKQEQLAVFNQKRDADLRQNDNDLAVILEAYGYQGAKFGGMLLTEDTPWKCKEKNEADIDELLKRKHDTLWLLTGEQADERRIREEIYTISLQALPLADITDLRSPGEKLIKMQSKINDRCTYGNILFSQCNHFTNELNRLGNPIPNFLRQLQEEYAGESSDKIRAKLDEFIAQEFGYSARLRLIEENARKLSDQLNDLENRIRIISRDTDRLVAITMTKKSNSKESPLVGEINELVPRQREMERELLKERSKQTSATFDLLELFNRLVKRILSPDYTGKVTFSSGIIDEFRLPGIKGEAVQALTTVIADITAMMHSVQGHGYHPRFLIHDSPREADLSGAAYAEFLKNMHLLAIELGGNDAPFQYIITTTTDPPDEVKSCVRLELCGTPPDRLLFKRNIEVGLEF